MKGMLLAMNPDDEELLSRVNKVREIQTRMK